MKVLNIKTIYQLRNIFSDWIYFFFIRTDFYL